MPSPPARAAVALALAAVATVALAGCASSRSPAPSTVGASTGPDLTLRSVRLDLPGLPRLNAADRLHVSCATRSFCEVVDETGLSWTWTGAAFTGPVRFAPSTAFPGLVSCPTAGFCMAAEEGTSYVLRGTNWTVAPKVSWPGAIAAVACASPQYCVSGPATTATDLRAWHGRSWTAGAEMDVGAALTGLDCARDGDTCVASGYAVTVRHAGGWGDPYRPGAPVAAVSCATGPFCMAVLDGKYAVWRDGSWREQPLRYGLQPGGLDCSSAGFCLGTDRSSMEVWNGTEWQPGPALPAGVEPLMFDLGAGNESCPSDGWCLLVAGGVAYEVTAIG